MTVWFVVVLRVLQSSGCFGRLAIATCGLRPFWLTRCWWQTEITHLHLISVFRLHRFTWIQVTAQECPCSEPCDDTLILSLYLDSTLAWNGKLTSPTSISGTVSIFALLFHIFISFAEYANRKAAEDKRKWNLRSHMLQLRSVCWHFNPSTLLHKLSCRKAQKAAVSLAASWGWLQSESATDPHS